MPTTVALGLAVCSATKRSRIRSRKASDRLVYPRREMKLSKAFEKIRIECYSDSADKAHDHSLAAIDSPWGHRRIARFIIRATQRVASKCALD